MFCSYTHFGTENYEKFKNNIYPEERKEANRHLPRLMVEGMLLGSAGLGVLALIFEIAAYAFSVAAYQTM